jgi:predicted transcriptional regulator
MVDSSQNSKKDTTVRVPWEILEEVKQIAKVHDRSLAAEVRVALSQYVRQSTEGGG